MKPCFMPINTSITLTLNLLTRALWPYIEVFIFKTTKPVLYVRNNLGNDVVTVVENIKIVREAIETILG